MAPSENAPVKQLGAATPTNGSPWLELAGMFQSQQTGTSFTPPRPRTLAQTGLTPTFLSEMVLKMMHFSSQLPAYEIASRLRLDYECIHQVMAQLASNSYIQSLGQAQKPARQLDSLEEGLAFMITESGRERAREILDRNQYMGPAPVPLHEYNQAVLRQALPAPLATHARLRRPLTAIVLA